ncbi:iron-containing alcohol dehydrogenase [Amycolatopsis rubida]|uniref:Iron-containing alcohol dehydrogenase n=1 Tax=Amycolatopsis rubida TaxID=112413 RepID=A0ABX0C744_9PSEU|nr:MULTISPECIES: iron-containing alcohol dehydrogenase [Amycolatopsis]MYW96256.1 iron-containing alcohol dehydrogenase [Amycolatopsis rubida]NEC61247.1 iron-containing alcohol dehydrogenase [Amycolatopsis rubida]OAP24223.1 Maleylacetate reductase [Amycolatopsis sp. M39]
MSASGRVALSRIENVVFGQSATDAVPAQVEQWGAGRVLILASRTLNTTTACVTDIANALGDRCVSVVDGVPEHTPSTAVMQLTARARELDVDAIVTVGGGTLVDAAKAVRMCLANGATSVEDLAGAHQPGGTAPRLPTVRQLSVPTTLSAAEFTGIAGVTDEATHSKALWRQPEIAPDSVVLDPAITRHTPEWLFLSTGLRAVDHAVEGFCALSANDYTDTQAARGFSLLLHGLAAVSNDPDNVEARLNCQLGAWMGMCPLASGIPMGASHGIGYVLGASYGVPHGYTSCVMLPAVLEWNAELNRARQHELLSRAGVSAGEASDVVRGLVRSLKLPDTLGALGVSPDGDGEIAVRSMTTPWVPWNPRPVAGPEQIREILALAR